MVQKLDPHGTAGLLKPLRRSDVFHAWRRDAGWMVMNHDNAGCHGEKRRPQDFARVYEHAIRRSKKRRVAADQLTAGIEASDAECLPVTRLEIREALDDFCGTGKCRKRAVAKPAGIYDEFIHLMCFVGSFRFSPLRGLVPTPVRAPTLPRAG